MTYINSYSIPALLRGPLVAVFAAGLWAQAPTGLTVKSATSKHIDLTWSGTASSYTVQRRALGSAYSTLTTVSTTSLSDTQIDPYTTYQYQVLAGQSAPSNQVTAGPPPAGFTVAAAPSGPDPNVADRWGYNLSIALDGNGDPALSFVFDDPNADTVHTDTQLLFRSWNRARYAWNPVVTVATVGDIATSGYAATSLAYDSSTNTFGLVTRMGDGSASLYVSTDGGATWTKKASFHPDDDIYSVSLALAGGNVHLAYVVGYQGLQYVTGKLSSDPSTWQTKKAPQPAGTDLADTQTTISLALDSNASPGIAYFAGDLNNGYNRILLLWRPASGADPVRVTDSQNNQSDRAAVRLVYHGLNPRILFFVQRNDAEFGVGDHFVNSNDGGLTWAQPVVIPPDGNSSTDYPFDLAVDSQDHAVAAFGQNSGSGDSVCGSPKVSRSADLVHWTTCAVTNDDLTKNFQSFPGAIQLAFAGNDRLYLVWWEDSNNPTGSGILMYREPPASASPAPVISSVVNAATFQPGIVAGSWVSILGANFSDVTRLWAGNDFNGDTLPTNVSGVQVLINGSPAPVEYVSPTQLNVQAPAGISGDVSVQVIRDGAPGNTVMATAGQNMPGLFTYAAGGKLYPAAVFPNGAIVGDPAVTPGTQKVHAGDRIELYATGLEPSPVGTIIHAPIGASHPVKVTIGSENAAVEYAGLVAVGEFQINIVVPSLADGEYELTLQIAGQSSQSGVIIPIGH